MKLNATLSDVTKSKPILIYKTVQTLLRHKKLRSNNWGGVMLFNLTLL